METEKETVRMDGARLAALGEAIKEAVKQVRFDHRVSDVEIAVVLGGLLVRGLFR